MGGSLLPKKPCTREESTLERLRSDIRAGKVRRVYGFRLDRFIRTGPADAFAFAKDCHQAGAERVAVADGVHVKPRQGDGGPHWSGSSSPPDG
jgi:DNA invertase Pin-like site-specific DNA recombinase